MKQMTNDLWQTDEESPFPGLRTHAYLLTGRRGGNVLFYNTTREHALDEIADLGGVAEHYLSHRDEVAPSLVAIRERFYSRLHASRAELDEVSAVCPVDDVMGDESFVGAGDVTVLPAPGHSPGSVFYRVEGDAGAYLFTGDSIFRGDDGRWHAGNVPGVSDPIALATSLRSMADLEVDVVISSAFGGAGGVTVLGDTAWSDCVAEALTGLGAGERVGSN